MSKSKQEKHQELYIYINMKKHCKFLLLVLIILIIWYYWNGIEGFFIDTRKKMVLYLRFKALGFFKTIKPTRGKAVTSSIFSLFALGLIFGGFLNPGSNKTLNAWESTTYNQGPPEFEILSAYAFQNIYKNGDIVFLSRIHLQQDKKKMATNHPAYNLYSWCDLLIDTSGCNSTPVNPTSPDRIDVDEITGKVPITFDLKENGAIIKTEPFIPRINYGFVGIYIENIILARDLSGKSILHQSEVFNQEDPKDISRNPLNSCLSSEDPQWPQSKALFPTP